jgi:hypothetical protein
MAPIGFFLRKSLDHSLKSEGRSQCSDPDVVATVGLKGCEETRCDRDVHEDPPLVLLDHYRLAVGEWRDRL